VERLQPVFAALGADEDRGWAHVGPPGAGHFVKMAHNGIECGVMQAYAEGFALLEEKKELELDLAQIAELRRHGSVIRSWLLDFAADAFKENPALQGVASQVADSGEGRRMVAEAIASDVRCPVITLPLIERIRFRVPDSFVYKILSISPHKFGGHGIPS
jgi:6-phosphogluconate dehydrogenase